jgi:hypothetical protein
MEIVSSSQWQYENKVCSRLTYINQFTTCSLCKSKLVVVYGFIGANLIQLQNGVYWKLF